MHVHAYTYVCIHTHKRTAFPLSSSHSSSISACQKMHAHVDQKCAQKHTLTGPVVCDTEHGFFCRSCVLQSDSYPDAHLHKVPKFYLVCQQSELLHRNQGMELLFDCDKPIVMSFSTVQLTKYVSSTYCKTVLCAILQSIAKSIETFGPWHA